MKIKFPLVGLLIGVVIGVVLMVIAFYINSGDALYPLFSIETVKYAFPTWVIPFGIVGLIIGLVIGMKKNKTSME